MTVINAIIMIVDDFYLIKKVYVILWLFIHYLSIHTHTHTHTHKNRAWFGCSEGYVRKKNVYTSGLQGQYDPTLKWMGNVKKKN